MKALILGAVGTMGLHTTAELAASDRFDRIVVADIDITKAKQMAKNWGLAQDNVVPLNAIDSDTLLDLISRDHDVIVNALPKHFALPVAQAVIAAGTRAIDLNSLSGNLHALDKEARDAGATYIAGCGSSSGLTNMMAKHGARGMTEIDSIGICFASFRSLLCPLPPSTAYFGSLARNRCVDTLLTGVISKCHFGMEPRRSNFLNHMALKQFTLCLTASLTRFHAT